ncbi:MAG: DUF1987 domain-containing protein [Bacteroidota bacterium]
MEIISIEATDETPRVHLDPNQHVLEFSGVSLPGDVTKFYDPILAWLETYKASNPATTRTVFKMEYFNTASSKMVMDILTIMEDLQAEGGNVTIDWFFKEDDEDMEEAGEEFDDMVEVPFNLQSFEG